MRREYEFNFHKRFVLRYPLRVYVTTALSVRVRDCGRGAEAYMKAAAVPTSQKDTNAEKPIKSAVCAKFGEAVQVTP